VIIYFFFYTSSLQVDEPLPSIELLLEDGMDSSDALVILGDDVDLSTQVEEMIAGLEVSKSVDALNDEEFSERFFKDPADGWTHTHIFERQTVKRPECDA
jgi:hypothetical protein